MTAIIINLDDYRKKGKPETPMEAALRAVKENGEKCPLKGIEKVDEHFKKYPFHFEDNPPAKTD